MSPDTRHAPSHTDPTNATQLAAALDLSRDAAPPRERHPTREEADLLREVSDLKAATRSAAVRSPIARLALKGGSGSL